MIFGATAFCEVPFADQAKRAITFSVIGSGIELATGTVNPQLKISVNGVRMDLAKGSVSVITWDGIDPNVNMIWTPIDPDE